MEESINNSLNAGFAYYMDEYDKEWLDKNNEEARGEGTSAQGAVSGARSASSQRSAKAKGKEPEVTQPVVMSEDEFELVMAVFEKVTHDKTEYLHHVSRIHLTPQRRINHVIQGLAEGMPFPQFSEYQDTFASPLPPSMFSNFITPAWLPSTSHLLKLARLVYPHWRERRLECDGQRIISSVNVCPYLPNSLLPLIAIQLDETDTKNESYICFRRREIKAVRKTRASQVTFSDKLTRLQSELTNALDIAGEVITRESLKKEALQQSQQVWEQRFIFSDLKRKFPTLSTKEDDELLIDKERAPKRVKTEGYVLCQNDTARISPSLQSHEFENTHW